MSDPWPVGLLFMHLFHKMLGRGKQCRSDATASSGSDTALFVYYAILSDKFEDLLYFFS